MLDGTDDPLRDIISMDVMQHLQPKVRQSEFFTSRNLRENFGIRIRLRINRYPARMVKIFGRAEDKGTYDGVF